MTAFVSFEGIEGSGKSTQAARLAAALGPGTVLTHEPGGTELGRGIRSLLLDPAGRRVAPATELLLFYADRAQHVAEVVRPALDAGRSVVTDRYVDSSYAYQGHGRGLPLDLLRGLSLLATGGLMPDLTLLLDVPVDAGLARVGRRGGRDRMEAELAAFHERVRDGYRKLAAAEPERWVRIDAGEGPDRVAAAVLAAVQQRGLAVTSGVR